MTARPLRCVIVDDEPLAREAVRSHVSRDPSLALVGEAKDGAAAIRAVERLHPDLLFLDIQMPRVDGFDVLDDLMAREVPLPATIFITAHDAYALRAFEAHALDYLLKPLREDRFRDTVALARARILPDRGALFSQRLEALLGQCEIPFRRSKLPVKVDGRIELVPLDRIEWIESEGNYVRLHLGDRTCLVRDTISALEERLDPQRFARIHRSAMVNLDHMEHVRPWFTGEYVVRLRSGRELTLTRSYRGHLFRLIGRDES
jgi:two-component system LytT family response regulator